VRVVGAIASISRLFAQHACLQQPHNVCWRCNHAAIGRRQVLDLLRSLPGPGSGNGASSGAPPAGLMSAADAEAVELLWEECGIPEGQHLTRGGWERFMLQVAACGVLLCCAVLR
jgi:hypothetical protein